MSNLLTNGVCVSILLGVIVQTGYGGDPTAADIDFFEKHIRPAFIEHCLECHSRAKEIQGGLSLDSRESIHKGGDTGPALVPGQADKSLLIQAIRYKNSDLQMPPRQKLPDKIIKAFETWIENGAADPRTSGLDSSTEPAMGMSVAAGRQFWSFKPVRRPAVPKVRNSDWVRTPIDAFILASLERKGMTPAPHADKRTLIRRVTFHLTGLPPSPDSIKDFLDDYSPDAFERVTQRLMSSPHYGVHWGRHWLDVARYADSNGLDENLAYGNAWRYRDYVIDSFNNDKSFQQFVIEQLAGDLLPNSNQETRTATGFLALGAKVLAEPDRKKLEMDIIDEQLDTMGKAFLGLTLGCVRCHDHKFDPFKQKDYYALAAIFKSTKSLAETQTGVIKHWYEHSFATDQDRKIVLAAESQIKKLKATAATYKNQAVAELRASTKKIAALYLTIAAEISPQMTLTEIARIAKPHGLHARILHHCRLHLNYHRDDSLFQHWHQHAEKQPEKIREYYAALFQLASSKPGETLTDTSGDHRFTQKQIEEARKELNDPSGFLAIPAKAEHAFDIETLQAYYDLLDKARNYESAAPDLPSGMGVADGSVTKSLPIHIRGSYRNLGESISREFPAVMRSPDQRTVFPSHQSGRLQLAEWIASTKNPLTARVIVNRVWGWHFGSPLVPTTENFGVLGKRPSHPELLDWLAIRFMEDGWSIKTLNRLILSSNVYRLSFSHPDYDRYMHVDPENRLLWRANLRRLPAEAIRDSILSVSGTLDEKIGGKTVPLRNRQFVFNHTSEDHTKYDSHLRAVYLPVIRNHLYTFFEQYNFPDPTMPTGVRHSTTVAPQALIMMNSEFVTKSAENCARLLCDNDHSNESRLRHAYLMALGRGPTSSELDSASHFISAVGENNDGDQMRPWVLFCQSLFASNEFIYIR